VPRAPIQMCIRDSHGTVRFDNCAFWGPTDRCAVVEGKRGGTVSFSNCTFAEWPEDREMPAEQFPKREPCIDATGGTVMVRGCEFRDHKPQLRLGPGLRAAIVKDNLMHWPLDIRSEAPEAHVIVSDNLPLRPS